MQRTQISLTDGERRLLDEAAVRTGHSLSRLIRDAVNATYDGGSVEDDIETLRSSFGAWRGREDADVDGEEWVEHVRGGRPIEPQ